MVHPDDLENTSKAWADAVRTKTPYQVENRVMMKNGEYRWHLSRAYPEKSDEGIYWYGTGTDVHDQKMLEMNLEKLVKERTLELERSNDDLQQFAHVASHDLKEPIRKIKTFSIKLQEELRGVLGERGNNLVNKMIHSTDRMYAMINGLLSYASVPGHQGIYSAVDLNVVIKNIEADLELAILEKEAKISTTSLPVIQGIPDLIQQLFYNLINNALKFSKPGVPVVIDLAARDVEMRGVFYHEIILKDNGIGFDNDYAEKIFSTFVRLNSKDQFEGSGLGLALCKRIVERHGGFIFGKGKRDEGAEFTVLLPKVL